MKIVIAGAGEVGSHLAKMLGDEYHDIIVIDDDPKRLEDIRNFADIVTINGDSTTFETQQKAEVKKANLFIAVCPDESKNIISAILAKQLGAKKSIARIDNDEYLQPNNKEIFINMGIDYLFYPEKVAANEVITLLGNTSTTEYVNFSGGKLVLVVFKLDGNSSLVDRSLYDFAENRDKLNYRTVAISRNGETIIPQGSDIFKEDDTIYVIADHNYVNEVMSFSGQDSVDVRNMMILGGSKIGQRVAMALQDKVNIKLVDYNAEKARRLSDVLLNTLVINEDGRNTEVMIEEELGTMDAFVAVTGRSETNILATYFKRWATSLCTVLLLTPNFLAAFRTVALFSMIYSPSSTARSSTMPFMVRPPVLVRACSDCKLKTWKTVRFSLERALCYQIYVGGPENMKGPSSGGCSGVRPMI